MTRRPGLRFAHRLALYLGEGNVDAMLRMMSSTQFARWEAFDALEPFGSAVEDHRAGVLASALANFAGKVAKKAFSPTDFFPLRGQPQQQAPSLAKRIVAALGGALRKER